MHGPAMSFGLLAAVYLLTLILTYHLPARVEETGWSPLPYPPWLACILRGCSRSPFSEGTTSLFLKGEKTEGEDGCTG
jgi:hypothetical protein